MHYWFLHITGLGFTYLKVPDMMIMAYIHVSVYVCTKSTWELPIPSYSAAVHVVLQGENFPAKFHFHGYYRTSKTVKPFSSPVIQEAIRVPNLGFGTLGQRDLA